MQEVLDKRLEGIEKKKQKVRVTKNTKKGLVRPKTATVRSSQIEKKPENKKKIVNGEMQPRYSENTPMVNISFL